MLKAKLRNLSNDGNITGPFEFDRIPIAGEFLVFENDWFLVNRVIHDSGENKAPVTILDVTFIPDGDPFYSS